MTDKRTIVVCVPACWSSRERCSARCCSEWRCCWQWRYTGRGRGRKREMCCLAAVLISLPACEKAIVQQLQLSHWNHRISRIFVSINWTPITCCHQLLSTTFEPNYWYWQSVLAQVNNIYEIEQKASRHRVVTRTMRPLCCSAHAAFAQWWTATIRWRVIDHTSSVAVGYSWSACWNFRRELSSSSCCRRE